MEALQTLWDILDDIDTASDMAKENDAWYRKRVEALQKKRWDTTITTDGYKLKGGPVEALRQALAQPEQEPVGQLQEDAYGRGQVLWFNKPPDQTMLYIAPPKREWVGLTDEQAWGVYRTLGLSFHRPNHVEEYEWALCMRDFAKAIEAKLKENNT
jgi:hypothetical protein